MGLFVDEEGNPIVFYHGTARREPAFRSDRGGGIGGIYFTPLPSEASAHAAMDAEVDSGAPFVVPAYLAITNPKVFTNSFESQEFTVEQMHQWEEEGFDGVVGRGTDGRIVEIAAFRAEQIKSAISNCMGHFPSGVDCDAEPETETETEMERPRG